MTWQSGKDKKGRGYSIDWAAANQVIGAYAYMRGFTEHARLAHDYNLLGKVKTVDVEPRAVQNTKLRLINEHVPKLLFLVQDDAVAAQRHLAEMRHNTMALRAQRDRMFATAEGSARSFNAWAGVAVGTMQLVRDTGFAAVAVIGAPMGGGIAFTAAMVGAGGAAGAKYSETGSVGAAMFAGTASLFMTGYGRVVAAGAQAERGILIATGVVIDSTLEFTGGMIEGKSIGDMGRAAMVKAISGGLGAGLDHAASGAIDAVWSGFTKLTSAVSWRDAATRMALEGSKKGTEKVVGWANEQLDVRAAVGGGVARDSFVLNSVLRVN